MTIATDTGRAGYILWTDNSDPIAVRFESDGAGTVDDAGLVAMIRGTLGPDGLGQYVSDADVLAVVLGLVELPRRPDGRRDILPLAGDVTETDADGVEV
jgi:hypothetical protein